MEERRTIFDYLSQVLCIFGFVMICMMCFSKLFGGSAKEISALFKLGKEGVPLDIMLEFLVLSVFLVLLRYVFFSDRLIKQLSVVKRTVFMVIGILVVISLFIVLFRWFPTNMWQPWVLTLFYFGICFVASTVISMIKEKTENKKLEEGLEKLKRQWEEKDGGAN